MADGQWEDGAAPHAALPQPGGLPQGPLQGGAAPAPPALALLREEQRLLQGRQNTGPAGRPTGVRDFFLIFFFFFFFFEGLYFKENLG